MIRTLNAIPMPLKPEHVALLNPYAPEHDNQEGMEATEAFRQQLFAQGTRMRLQQLYNRDGSSAGTRVGLMDDNGFFAEYFFSHDSQQHDPKKVLRILNDHNGKAPAFWATDLL